MLNPTRVIALCTLMSISPACSPGGSDFSDEIRASTNMPEEVAICIGELAEKELTPEGRKFLIAGMKKDNKATAQLRSEMSIVELTQAGMFMVGVATRCHIPDE